MRTAVVIASSELSVRLAATSSLTLAAAKAADVVGEQRSGLAAPRPLTTVAAAGLAGGLSRKALTDHTMSAAIDSAGMLTGLAEQSRIELQVRRGDSLHEVTALSAAAAGSIFAATASLAGTPANAAELRRMGEAYGRMAHILDAVEDLEDDTRSGAFNPLTATGHSVAQAKALCLSLARTIRNGLEELALTDARLLRLLLVDVVHTALHRIFDAPPESSYPPPGPGYPPPGSGGRSFWRNVVPWVGVYCTGFALCASHDNPCTGRRHNAGCGNCDCGDCDCDCCDCDCCCDCSSTSHSGDAGGSQHHACSVSVDPND